MFNSEFERKLGSLRIKQKSENEIFHNKVYLFNTQTIENNIKKLKESLMQKTQFIKKHETIDNIQKEFKYNLIRSSNDIISRGKNKRQNSSFLNDKIFINNSITNNLNNDIINEQIELKKGKFENDEILNQYQNEINQNNKNHKIKANQIEISDKNITYLDNINNVKLDGYAERTLVSQEKQADKSTEYNKNYSPESIKNTNNKLKTEKGRFLTSLDNTQSNKINLNNETYSLSAQKKIQNLSNKLAIKSRNMIINTGTIKGNSDSNNIGINQINQKTSDNNIVNNFNVDVAKLNFLSSNNKIQNYDIKDKINQSFYSDDKADHESKQNDFLQNYTEKSSNLNQNPSQENHSNNVSKSDSGLKMLEGDLLDELNLVETNKNIIKNKKTQNNILESEEVNYSYAKDSDDKITNTDHSKVFSDAKADLKKTKNRNKLKPTKIVSPLNRNLKEIDLSASLNSLEIIESNGNLRKKNSENISLIPNHNPKLTNDHLFSSTQYLLSNPNLITNTEINANLKSQIKFYNTQNNIRNFTELEAEVNFSVNSYFKEKRQKKVKIKKQNRNTNILIDENYSNSIMQSFDRAKLNKSKIEKETNISSNLINNESQLSKIKELNLSKKTNNNSKSNDSLQIKNPKNLSEQKNFKRFDSNVKNNFSHGKNEQTESEIQTNLNAKTFKKMKITDRIALMSKGVLKESYDEETEKIFSKIFSKNLEQILEMKKYPIRAAAAEKINLHDERYEYSRKNYISKEITDLKEKVYFLKGTLDYIFPQFLIGKLKETVKKQKNSKIRNTLSQINEKNSNFNNLYENDHLNKNINYNKKKNGYNSSNDIKKHKNDENLKENEFLFADNSDKTSSNGNSKNEFFLPNIKLNRNINNNNNNINNDIKSFNNQNNIQNSSYDNYKNVDYAKDFSNFDRENEKKNGKIAHGFRSISFNNRYNIANLNKTKLISPDTNSCLFKRLNNFKNLGKSTSMQNASNLLWNNSMNETNLYNDKKLIKKQILTKTLSIQNMHSMNNI